jgi:hypothetical protein
MVSITNPGLWFGDQPMTRTLAARATTGARQVRITRGDLDSCRCRADVDATLAEIGYAYDTLKVDGIGLFELQRHLAGQRQIPSGDGGAEPARQWCTFIPLRNCCRNLTTRRASAWERGTAPTPRTIVGVAFSGDARRYPDVLDPVARRRYSALPRGSHRGARAERATG